MRPGLFGCCVSVVVMNLILAATVLAAGLPIVFVPPKDRSPDKVFIQFMGGSDFSAQYRDSNGALQPVSLFTAYSLTQLTNATPIGSVGANQPAVLLNSYSVGRIYISYGDNGLQDNALQKQPSSNDSSDLDYYTRWQYVELTYAGTSFQINLSYIDFTSIPISIAAVNASHATNTPQLTTVLGSQLVAAAAQGSTTPYAASLPNQTHFNSTFVRVLGSRLRRGYRDWNALFESLPKDLSEILRRGREGRLDVRLDHKGLDGIVNRLVYGLLASALFVGSCMVLSSRVPPLLFDISLFGAAGCVWSLLLGLRLLRAIRRSGSLGKSS